MPTLLLLLAATTSPAWSADVEGQYGRLPESVARIERETGGKVLQVKSIRRGDREIYRMKVLTPDGRIKVMHDDPRHPRDFNPQQLDADASAGMGRDEQDEDRQ